MLVLVVYYVLVWSPQRSRVAEIEDRISQTITQQQQVRDQIARLEEVRASAPRLEAALADSHSIIPRDSALPSALRQLQLAADDAGATLVSIQPGRPEAVGSGEAGGEAAGEAGGDTVSGPAGDRQLARLSLSVQVQGRYFQLVDFLRRIEDPAITPRGIVWSGMSIGLEEYPVLSLSASGEMYALLSPAAAGTTGESSGQGQGQSGTGSGQ